jgi:hypothetical protein
MIMDATASSVETANERRKSKFERWEKQRQRALERQQAPW